MSETFDLERTLAEIAMMIDSKQYPDDVICNALGLYEPWYEYTNFNRLHHEKASVIQVKWRRYFYLKHRIQTKRKVCEYNKCTNASNGRFCSISCSRKYAIQKRWDKEGKENTPVRTPSGNKKKCGVCNQYGHNKRTCFRIPGARRDPLDELLHLIPDC